MEHLPPSVQEFLEGGIDPYAQQNLEWYSNIYLGFLVAVAFVASYLTGSVVLALQIFGAGFLALMIAGVPAWPYLKSHPIKFLPARKRSLVAPMPAKR